MGTGGRRGRVTVVGSREGGDHWPSVDCVFRHGFDIKVSLNVSIVLRYLLATIL